MIHNKYIKKYLKYKKKYMDQKLVIGCSLELYQKVYFKHVTNDFINFISKEINQSKSNDLENMFMQKYANTNYENNHQPKQDKKNNYLTYNSDGKKIIQQMGMINYGPTNGMIEYKDGLIVKNYKDIKEGNIVRIWEVSKKNTDHVVAEIILDDGSALSFGFGYLFAGKRSEEHKSVEETPNRVITSIKKDPRHISLAMYSPNHMLNYKFAKQINNQLNKGKKTYLKLLSQGVIDGLHIQNIDDVFEHININEFPNIDLERNIYKIPFIDTEYKKNDSHKTQVSRRKIPDLKKQFKKN